MKYVTIMKLILMAGDVGLTAETNMLDGIVSMSQTLLEILAQQIVLKFVGTDSK